MNVIEFRFCDEDRARLDRIAAALESQVPPRMVMGVAKAEDVAVGKTFTSANHYTLPVEGDAQFQQVDVPTPFDEETPAPTPESKPISLAEFQKAIVTRAAESPAVKAKVQALVHRYAEAVSAIPEDKRAEVLAELSKL